MLVVHGIKNINNIKKYLLSNLFNNKLGSAVTIGNFDGVHLGHSYIIKELNKQAKNHNLYKLCITFEPHSKEYFSKKTSQKISRLTVLKDKLKIFKQYDFDLVWVINFNDYTANISAQDFINKILKVCSENLLLQYLIIGHDFKFGKNREGDINLLADMANNYNFKLDCVDAINSSNNTNIISSSRIRELLNTNNLDNLNHNLKQASKLLNRNYGFTSKVISGHKLGKKIGFPTINLYVKPNQLILSKGVYAVYVIYNNTKYQAMANWGVRPTVSQKLELVLEANVFDFDQNIYGKYVYIEFIQKIREEQKFANKDELISQLSKDRDVVTQYFAQYFKNSSNIDIG